MRTAILVLAVAILVVLGVLWSNSLDPSPPMLEAKPHNSQNHEPAHVVVEHVDVQRDSMAAPAGEAFKPQSNRAKDVVRPVETRPTPALRRADYYPTASLASALGIASDDPRAEWLYRWYAEKSSRERDLRDECDEGRDRRTSRAQWNAESERRRTALVAELGPAHADKVLERYPIYRFRSDDPTRWERINAFGKAVPFRASDEDVRFPPIDT